MPVALDQALDFNGKALALRAQRQQVLAANIANADTPNFKAQDFDFTQALDAATGGASIGQTPLPLRQSNARHLVGETGGLPTAMLYRVPMQPSLDGNTVDMDQERTRFADNSVRYEASLRFLNGQIRTLQSAVTGQ